MAIVSSDGKLMNAWKMPETEADIYNLIAGIWMDIEIAYIEEVASRPGQNSAGTFKFGMGYGGLRMALVACRIPFQSVRPQVWQKRMGCLTHGDKNISKSFAQRLWPEFKFTHATADCAILAEYGRRYQLGLL